MKSEIINVALFEHLEKDGKEVQYKYNKKNKKIIAASVIDPVRKLFDSGFFTHEEFAAINRYSKHFELSKKVNLSTASYEALGRSKGKISEYIRSLQLTEAGKCVDDIKLQVRLLTSHRKRKLRKVLKKLNITQSDKTSHEQVLEYLFEQRKKVRNVEILSGINHDLVLKKAKDISQLISVYYKKRLDY